MIAAALQSLNNLVYPALCAACGRALHSGEPAICTRCRITLPFSAFEREEENPVTKVFAGRLMLLRASALFIYTKGGPVARLMQDIKYRGNREAGLELGRLMGSKIADARNWELPDLIVPVPLSYWRLQRRGYNQAALLAQGISDITGIPIEAEGITKSPFTKSQTGFGRFFRWKNVEHVFKIKNPTRFEGKHILMVDDTLTTGATLEALGIQLLQCGHVRLSVATAAMAVKY